MTARFPTRFLAFLPPLLSLIGCDKVVSLNFNDVVHCAFCLRLVADWSRQTREVDLKRCCKHCSSSLVVDRRDKRVSPIFSITVHEEVMTPRCLSLFSLQTESIPHQMARHSFLPLRRCLRSVQWCQHPDVVRGKTSDVDTTVLNK